MMRISKPIRLLQGSLLVAALAFAGHLARANDLLTNPRGSEPPMVLAQAQENEPAEKAKAAQLEGQIQGDEATLRRMEAEEAKEAAEAKRKGIPDPPTVARLKEAARHLRQAEFIMKGLPSHYQGYGYYAEVRDWQAQVAVIHCIAIDRALARKAQPMH